MRRRRVVVAGAAGVALMATSAFVATAAAPGDGPGAPVPAAGAEVLVGTDVTSLAPDPAKWQTEGCVGLDQSAVDPGLTHLADKAVADMTGSWPTSPDCIYMGGYGIGPARAATGVDPFAGINVRSLAISNGSATVLWQVVDMVGFFSRYRADLCDDCGILDIRHAIGERTGLAVEAIAVGSTHTHGGADGYGAWGGLPTWYRSQIRDAVVASGVAAVAALEPATLTIGSTELRAFNNERRDHYYSTPDYGAVWLQARAVGKGGKPGGVLATLLNYAAHPVVLGDDNVLLHGDWPAVTSKVLGDSLGGVGLVFEGGLGNVSPAGGRADTDLTGDGTIDDYDEVIDLGTRIARSVAADIGRGGSPVSTADIAVARSTVTHPATNAVLVGGAQAGLLDRDFSVTSGDPAAAAAAPGGPYEWGKQSTSPRRCVTASPLAIVTDVSGFRIGSLTVVTGPGELFSNMTEVVKSKARRDAESGGQTMVFSQTQDSLGYIAQSFEVDPAGGVAEYVPEVDVAEYEEFFMLDRCFGDHVLDAQLGVVAALDRAGS